MSFKVTPSGQPAPQNPHALDRASRPSPRDRALAKAAALQSAAQPPKQPEPLSIPEIVEAKAAQDTTQNAPIESKEEIGQSLQGVDSPKAATAVEATPEAPKTAPEVSKEPLSAQYAQLARKERALRQKAMELKQREDAFLKSQESPKETPKVNEPGLNIEDLKKNPWKVLKDAGITYDQLTQQALNEPSQETQQLLTTIDSLNAKIEAMENRITGSDKAREEDKKAQYQQVLNQFKNEVTALVKDNPEFETVKATGSIGDVVDLIEKTYKEDGILLSVEDATKEVEDYLVEEAYKLSQLSKIQKRLKPAPTTVAAAPAKQPGTTETKQPQPTKTLSNAMNGSRQMTARERAMAAAIHGPNWREKI